MGRFLPVYEPHEPQRWSSSKRPRWAGRVAEVLDSLSGGLLGRRPESRLSGLIRCACGCLIVSVSKHLRVPLPPRTSPSDVSNCFLWETFPDRRGLAALDQLRLSCGSLINSWERRSMASRKVLLPGTEARCRFRARCDGLRDATHRNPRLVGHPIPLPPITVLRPH